MVQLLSHLVPLARYRTHGAAQAALPTCLAQLLLSTPGLLATDAAKAGYKGLLRLLQTPPSPSGEAGMDFNDAMPTVLYPWLCDESAESSMAMQTGIVIILHSMPSTRFARI